MSGNESSSTADPPPSAEPRRFRRPTLRQASLILPRTGERVRKTFTLRPTPTTTNGTFDESRPLLPRRTAASQRSTLVQTTRRYAEKVGSVGYSFASSRVGQGILKCSIAYLIGSLATLVGPIAATLGRQDGKHMVATVTVYFHPARSAGSMAEAFMLALIAVSYAAVVSFSSMAVSIFFGTRHLLAIGHAIVLIVFCGGALGFVGWLKQKLGNALVNVACSLTSLAIITVLTKEGAVQSAYFSYDKIFQVLKMVLMGMAAAVAVSLLIKPRSARNDLCEDLAKITDQLEESLTMTTRGFLSGQEDDLKGDGYAKLSTRYRSTFNSMIKNLRESKFEHCILGTERRYRIESRLVHCIERLGQSLIGLRSAAYTQYDLIASNTEYISPLRRLQSVSSSVFGLDYMSDRHDGLSAIAEEIEEQEDREPESQAEQLVSPGHEPAVTQPADIFALFISQLGPSMKSLAYTLKEILNDLPFSQGSERVVVINSNFRSSLVQAIELFTNSRKQSLEHIYKSRVLTRDGPVNVAADTEEVAASCGYFSSCLQDFAEDTVAYLDILEELKSVSEESPRKRSWTWLYFWRRSTNPGAVTPVEERLHDEDPERRLSQTIPNPKRHPTSSEQDLEKAVQSRPISIRLWRALRFLRKEDVRFAVKVGIGATLYAAVSFIPSTRPFYQHWRGEWGLLSYMLVCSMTIGASNTTGLQRFFGTCIGALVAVLAWIISDDNPVVLGFLGWLVSVFCFYIILGLGKGPMGRFILLTYNLSALYAYSLTVRDDVDDDDEGGIDPAIWEIVLHRVVAVMTGCLWGLIVTRIIWPISARTKLKQGISLLWLRMGLIWKRDPLSILIESGPRASYMDICESVELKRFLMHLQALRESATHEFELRGPFPDNLMVKILESTERMVGAFTAINTVIMKDLKASSGEAEILQYTRGERGQLSARISHLFSVLASSMKLEYPINDALPNVEHTRDRLLARIFHFRHHESQGVAEDEDYELIYAYVLVTGQIAKEIETVGRYIEQLYGVLDEDTLKLQ